jgi:hypothetical protein
MKGETSPPSSRAALRASLAKIKLLTESLAWPSQVQAARALAERVEAPRARSSALAAVELLTAAVERAVEGDAAALPSIAEHAMNVVATLTAASRVKGAQATPRDARRELRVVKDLAMMAERAFKLAPKRDRA